ncbi:hypothetical protein QT318_17365 [Escherichia coli]|nr:hypothetical protein [Escherichia coli]
MQVGDFSTGVDLNGNNNSVTLAAKDLKVVGQKATGKTFLAMRIQ